MKKLSFLLPGLIFLAIFSCDKKTISPEDQAIAQFKETSGVQFSGRVIDNELNWVFSNWDNGIGALNSFCTNNSENKTLVSMSFYIYDNNKEGYINSISMIYPNFQLDTASIFSGSEFEIGSKTFHTENDTNSQGFIINVETSNKTYSTFFGDQSNSSLKIVKTQLLPSEPGLSENDERLAVWMLISCDLYDDNGHKVGEISNGKLLSELQTVLNN